MKPRLVGVNESGLRVGQDHQRAKLLDADVEALLTLREEGWSINRLAEKFEITKMHAFRIVMGAQRCQRAVRYRPVKERCVKVVRLIEANKERA